MNASLPQNQAFRPGWLKSCTLALTTLLVAGLSWSAEAQTTLYNYTNATSGSPASVAAGLAGTNLSRGAGVDTTINCAANQGFGSDGWPTTNTFDVDMFNGSGDYIEFTLDPNVGSTLLISGFTANSRRENPSGTNNDGPASLRYAYSKTGAPGSWTFVNPGNPQASSTCGSLGVTRVWTSFPSVSVSGSETITFRIYGLSSGANMTGDLFLRNIAVSGYVCTSTPTASLTPVSFCEGTDAYDIPVASSTADITSYSLSFSPAGIPSVSGTLPSPGALPSVLTIAADMAGDGVYSGTLTLTNACGSNTVIYFPDLVTINPLPVVNITIAEESGVADDDGTVCPGDEATITASGGGTYLWSTSETTASVTVSPATNTIYDVTVTNLGCEQTASATILVTAPETADAGPDQSTCINGTVLLAGSFGGTATGASWSDNGAGGSFLPNASTLNAYYIPPVNNTDPITLTLSTDGPCPVSDEVIISYDAEPAMTLSANASSSTATCNDQVTVTIEVEEGYNDLSSLQFSINWNASAFSLVSHSATAVGGSTPSTSTPGMGVLTYSWFDMMGDFGEDLPDGTVLLTMTFDILNASGLESIDIANSPTIIEGVTWQQCELDITLNNDADINLEPITIGLSIEEESGIADNDGNICAGDDVTLTASGGVSYEWSPGGETTESITVSPTSSTTYTVTVTDSNGCTNSATAEIRVNPLPMAAVTVDLNEICIGGAIEITFYEGVYPDGTEFILSANIEDANGPNPNNPISYSEVIDTDHIDWTEGFDFSGDLSVSDITVTNPATGCSSVVDGFEVDVLDAPVLSFTAQADGDDPQSGGSNGPTTVTLEFCEGDFFSFTAYNVNDPRVGVLEELDGTGNVTAGGPPAVVVPRPQTDITPASVDGFFNGGPYGPYGLESGTYGQFVQTFTPYLDIDGVPGYSAGDCLGETVTLVYNVHANPTPSIDVTETSGVADDDSAICLGASVTLTASGGNTYLWSTMATTASITVSPTTTTTYTVTVTDNDCSTSISSVINVTPMPSLNATLNGVSVSNNNDGQDDTGAFAICNGSNITFDAFADANGASGNIKAYQTVSLSNVSLSFCNNCAALVTAFPGVNGAATLVNPALPGTVTLSFRVFNDLNNNNAIDADECPNDWVVYTITVNPIPVPAIAVTENSGTTPNDGAICEGASATLTASGGDTYLWSPGGATTSSITVSPTSTTTYTVTVTSNNCSTSTSSVITVNPLPAVSLVLDPNEACVTDDGFALDGGIPTGGTYSGAGIMTSPTFEPAGAQAGVHTITYTYTDANGCVNTATDDITVYELLINSYAPASQAQTICDGENTSFRVNFTSTPDVTVSATWQIWDGDSWEPLTIAAPYSTTLNNTQNFARLNITAASYLLSGAQYRVVLNNGACETISDPFTLTVNGPVSIDEQPESVTICGSEVDQEATFTAVVSNPSGTTNLRWQYFDGTNWVNTGGAGTFGNTTNTLTVNDNWAHWPAPGSSVQLRLRAQTPGCPAIFSDIVTLSVNFDIDPLITGPLYVNSMAAVSFFGAPGITPPATFAGGTWAVSGGPGTVSVDFADDYNFVVTGDLPGTVTITYQSTDDAGCTGTEQVTLTVLDKLTLSAIPSDLTVSCGEEITVNIEADNLVELIEMAYNLTWDPSELAYVSSSGTQLGDALPVIDATNAATGLLYYYWGGEYTGMPLNDHVLLSITFTVLQNSGSAGIFFDSPVATNTSISNVPINTNDGVMSVTPILIVLDNPDPVCPVDCDDAQGQIVTYGITTTGNPDQYSLIWGMAAAGAGFAEVNNAVFDISNGEFTVVIPCGLEGGTYGGTLTVTDSETGCTGTTSIAVVIDDQPPVITECPASVTVSCESSDDFPDADPDGVVAEDACGPLTVDVNEANNEGGGCVGDPLILTRTYTVTDPAGNSTNCIQTITMIDEDGPVLAGNAPEFEGDCFDSEEEAVEAVRDYVLAYITDECHANGIEVEDLEDIAVIYDEFDCSVTIQVGAIDGCTPGNASTFEFGGIIIDGTAPTLTLTDIDDCYETIADALAAAVDPMFTTVDDDCPGTVDVTAEIDDINSLCAAMIIVTATDACGNVTTGSYGPVRIDGTSPVIENEDPLLLANTCFETFEEAAAAAEAAIEAGDNCVGELIIGTDELAPDAECPYTLTVRVTDECGNFSLYQFTGVKIDNTPPVPVFDEPEGPLCYRDPEDAKADLLLQVDWEDDCGFPVMYETAEYSNETDPNPNDECEFGVVTITAVDLCGQSFSIDIDVKIDATPPYVIDQNGLPVLTGDCIGEVPADVDAIAMLIADNCDQGFDLVFDGDELSEEDGCVIIRSYTATDACGLSATFTQRIEISDEEAPVWGDEETNNPDLLLISCSAGTEEISLEDLIQSALNQDPPAVTDNCEGEDEDVAYITVSVETFDPVADPECPNGYSITKIWTAVDQCGNASTYTRIVQVTDNEAPGFDPFCQFMPLNIYTAEGYACPEDAEISLEVGQEIDNATTWTVAGYPVPALGSCIFDNCSDASNIVVTVEAIDMGDDDETLPCTRTITVTFSLTDECGNTQEDPFICVYNIIDNTSPTWETEEGELDRVVDCNIPSELNDALALAPVPVDNCDDEPFISLPDVVEADGDCEGEYTITRTWIASDHCYNSNSPVFTQTIHVIDNDPPTFNPTCQFMPLEILTSDGYDCPADAEITLTVGQELNINSTWNVAGYPVASLAGCISDACSAPESIKITVESILDATDAETCNRTITVSFRLEDACGNVQPQLFVCIYEIIDDTEPVFDEESIDAIADCYDSIDDAVEAALDAATPHASDNCTEPLTNDNFTFTVSSNEEDCTVTINVYVTDCAGNSDVVTFNTKVDNEPPTLIANCSALAPSYPTATAAQTALQLATSYEDNCPGPFSIVNAFTVGTCDAIVTLVYADACGNTSTVSCATSINSSPLTLICPAPVTRNTDAGECNYTVTANDLFAPTISGGCSPYAVSYVLSGATTGSGTGTSLAGIDFNKGTTVISWTVSDDNNATTACSVSVTVVDTQSPTIACPANITKGADNNQCSAVTTYAVTASDNCMFTVTQTAGLPSGSAFPVGTTVNGFQVVDMSGNSANCSFNVTVNDTQLPTIACPANIVTGTTTGQCSAVVNYTVTASDNCGGTLTPVLISGPASGSTFPLGTTGPIQWRATDGAGNSANCSFSVTVNDTQAPDIVCPANITVPAMGGGCSATVNYNVTATDNCGGTITPTLVSGGASGSTFTGTSTVVWSATDAAQNMATCSFTVSVSDGQAPTISCPVAGAVTRSTNVNDCFYTVVGNEFNATGSDNCGAPTITYAVSGATTGTGTSLAGVGLNKGTNTIVWTATDAGGNTAICSFTVQVNDTRPPVVSCPPSQTVNAAANACGATVNPGTLGATDNCGAPSTTFGPIPNANFFPIGMTTLTGTATDNSGNTAMCTTKITVIDNSAPVFTKCPANLTLNNIEGGCTGNYTGIDSPEATDNCAFTLTWTTSGAGATPGSGSGPIPGSTVFNSGTTTVTYVATDASGNTAVCSYTVTVVCVKIKGTIVWEHDPPVIGVKNATVTLMGTSPAITLTTTTDTTGMFMFSIPGGNSSIMVEPTKPALNNAQKLDGVTIADAQAITNHLNNMAPITDPYKLIAADVNSTNTVTTVDASTISSALLGNPLALAAFEPSWKFINANTVLPNPPASPFALYNANKKITITGPVNTDQLSVNFIGIKSGNVNGSPAPVFAPSSPLIWLVEDRTTQAGQEFDVTFSAVQFNELSAYQFAIDFDPTQLQLIDIQPMNALSLSAADNFGAFQAETGELRAGWFNASNVTLGAGTPVFKVRFKALTSGAQLSNLIQLNDAILPGKAFNTALVESPVVLSFSDLNTSSTNTAQTNSRLQLLQNRPNPFNEETTIGFVLPEACEASLRIYDLSGREITSHSRYYSAGYHEVMFRVTNASDYGIMFYELTTPSGRLVRKMISTGK